MASDAGYILFTSEMKNLKGSELIKCQERSHVLVFMQMAKWRASGGIGRNDDRTCLGFLVPWGRGYTSATTAHYGGPLCNLHRLTLTASVPVRRNRYPERHVSIKRCATGQTHKPQIKQAPATVPSITHSRIHSRHLQFR